MSTKTQHFRLFLFLVLCGALTLLPGRVNAQDEQGEEEESEQPWNLSLGANYLSRYSSLGVDLSQDEPALQFVSTLKHSSGFSGGINVLGRTGGNAGYQQADFHVGYEHPIAEILTVGGVYTYYSYASDTISVLAGISNSFALSASLDLSPVTVSIGYNLFFGNSSTNANYFSGGVSGYWEIGRLAVNPAIEATVASTTVETALLPKNRGQAKGLGMGQGQGQGHGQGNGTGATTSASTLTETITGLTNVTVALGLSYQLGNGFTCSLTPAYLHSPTDLSARASQFIVTAGVSYSVDF